MEEYFIIPPFKVKIFTSNHGLIKSISLSPIFILCNREYYIRSPAGEQVLFFFTNYLENRQWCPPPDFPLDWSRVSSFTREVLLILQKRVPFGSVISYSELARLTGRPRACRAVGRALATNPWPVVIPCHRVIKKDGGLGGFSAGIQIKRVLLLHEGVLFH